MAKNVYASGLGRRLFPRFLLALIASCLAYAPAIAGVAPPPIIAAARRGDSAAVQSLLRQGASADTADSQGMTALHYASYRGDIATVRVLLRGGASPLVRDGEGITALEATAFDGYSEVARLLLRGGAKVNAADHAGLTALHVTSAGGHEDFVKLLLAAGADPSLRSADGRTAAQFADKAGASHCAALLRESLARTSRRAGSIQGSQPEPPRKARIVITDENLPHVETSEDAAPTAILAGKAHSADSGRQISEPSSAYMDPIQLQRRIRFIREREVEIMNRLPKLREDCQNHQRFNNALDNNQPIPSDLKEMAEQYGTGAPSVDVYGKVNVDEVMKVREQTRKQVRRNRRDTQSACGAVKSAEAMLKKLDLEIAQLQ
jgi:hypothetical protein